MIPASIKPLLVRDEAWFELKKEAHAILSALEKLGNSLNFQQENALQRDLFSQLSPIEKQAARQSKTSSMGIATARMDLFFDEDALFVIEVNTTIPAMQAYSDMIRAAFYEAHGQTAAPSSSNTQDLLDSLLGHYQKSGGRQVFPRIAIVARAGDSQLAELLWLQKKWQLLGYETLLVTPDEISIKSQQIFVRSIPIDLCYRHIFAHKLLADSAFASACREASHYRIFNPMTAHLEAKAVLAELSRIAADEALTQSFGLTEGERSAIQKRVVWSRLLDQASTKGPDGSSIPKLLAWVKAHRTDLVIKSSLGYGGQGVFIGSDFFEAATQLRAQALLGKSQVVLWEEFADFCANSSQGQWIVQRKLRGRRAKHKVLVDGQFTEQESYLDCSIFTNSGVDFIPSGGACRFSAEAIVNIAKGGGLAPLLLESEWQSLLSNLKAKSRSFPSM
ncbi:MAG: hypothetical protein NTX25_19570 [Proteobacteria bacterium]|nr:hypothetical protein [Pseudomonadota bacterium]